MPTDGNGLVAPAWDAAKTVTVRGHNSTSLDLPVRHVQGATVRVTTFNDGNGNGSWDDGEGAREGMSVCLLPPGGYGGINNIDSPKLTRQAYSNGQSSCGPTGPDGVFLAGPALAGDYVLTVGPLLSGAPFTEIPPENLTLTEGQALDLNIPVAVLSPEAQLIPDGSGTPLTYNTCYSDPTWVQPPFEDGYGRPSSGVEWPPEGDARQMYSRGIYFDGNSQDWYIWTLISGLDWFKGPAQPGCSYAATGPIRTIDFAGYEPVKGVQLGDVRQITLTKHDTGFYVTRIIEPEGSTSESWYLFVDESDRPIARCSSYGGRCEWFN